MHKFSSILFGLFIAINAHAAHRTFVAASGTDAGSCGPTTPCRTLDYAMGQTDSGGEVIITESGGYGSTPSGGITITKSISIIAEPGIFAALAPTTGYNGIDIATAGIKVIIKGLNINSRGGNNGINMTDGTSLLVEKSSISGFSSGNGMYVHTSATVNVVNSMIRDNQFGIWTGAGATMSINGSTLLNNGGIGAYLYTNGTVTGATSTINFSATIVSGSSWCVACAEQSGNTGVINATRVNVTQCAYGFFVWESGINKVTVSDSTSSNNGIGLYTDSTSSTLVVSGSTVSNNTIGFNSGPGSSFISLGNNAVYGNTTNSSGVITSSTLQ